MRTLSDFELSKVLDTLKSSVENLELATATSQLEDKIAECLDRIDETDRAWTELVVRKGCYDIAPDGCSFEDRYLMVGGQILVGPEFSSEKPLITEYAGKVIYIKVSSPNSVSVEVCNSMEELALESFSYENYVIPLYNFKRTSSGTTVVDLRNMPRADVFATVASVPPSEG